MARPVARPIPGHRAPRAAPRRARRHREPAGAAPDALTAAPHRVAVEGNPTRTVRGWAGPWPLYQRWWTPGAVPTSRLQIDCDDGTALLLAALEDHWWVVGIYD